MTPEQTDQQPAKRASLPYQCQECGRRTKSLRVCPKCGSTDIDLAPLPGMLTGPGTPWRFR